MRRMMAGGFLVAVVAALAACSSEAPPPAPKAEDRALQEAIQAPLDKARAVEDDVLKAQQEQQKKIDEQGG